MILAMCTNGPCKDKIQFTVIVLKNCSQTETWDGSGNEKHIISRNEYELEETKKADYKLRERKNINRV